MASRGPELPWPDASFTTPGMDGLMSLQAASAAHILTPEEREASTQGWRSHSGCFLSWVECYPWTTYRVGSGGILPHSSKAKSEIVLHINEDRTIVEHRCAPVFGKE